jgi:MFS family permease
MVAVFFVVGSTIQTASHGSYVALLVGRVIGGLAVGSATVVVPIYVAEASPPAIRGRLVGIYEIFVSGGTLIGFWINYGLSQHVSGATSAQWEVSFGIQLAPGGLLLFGLLWLPESPRWLAGTKGREACVEVLTRLRKIPADHAYMIEEVNGIFDQIRLEEAMVGGSGFRATLKEMWQPSNRKRLALGSLMFIFMQMAGANSINYYSPMIFESMGVSGTNSGLFATGIYGLVRFVATMISMLWVVDRYGRTGMLMAGSTIMVSQLCPYTTG